MICTLDFVVLEHSSVSRNWDCQCGVVAKAWPGEMHGVQCEQIQLQEHWTIAGIVWPP